MCCKVNYSVVLFLLLPNLGFVVSKMTSIKKCCERSQFLDTETFPCVEKPEFSGNFPVLPQIMIDHKSGINRTLKFIETPVEVGDLEVGFVSCDRNKYRVLNMTRLFDYSIATDGHLISLTGAFQSDFRIGDFCIDFATSSPVDVDVTTWHRVALTCDRCQNDNLACIRSCCSNFNLAEINPINNEFSCSFSDELGPTLNPATWSPNLDGSEPEAALVYAGRFGFCNRNQTKSEPELEIMGSGSNSSYRLLELQFQSL